MKYTFESKTLRRGSKPALAVACERFAAFSIDSDRTDALYRDARNTRVAAWSGLSAHRPLLRTALNSPTVAAFLAQAVGPDADVLLQGAGAELTLHVIDTQGKREVPLPVPVAALLRQIQEVSGTWIGTMTANGDHCFDPRTPTPGTHFRANVLIGDRAGFPNPLLTTPKAIVDAWGGGSSRSHANKEILQTQWGPVPDENGFPVNRQFYLVEDGKQVFFSANPGEETDVQTRHAANHTVITYRTPDGLEITRTIFVVPAEKEAPYAMEAQLIKLTNHGERRRDLRLVATGMLGYPHPGALTVDVIYTCVTVQPRVLWAEEGSPMVVSPDYTAPWGRDDQPFNMTLAYDENGNAVMPDSYCLDYSHFIGAGSIAHPENVVNLDNDYPKKGPAFFAVGCPMSLNPGNSMRCHSFNGSISRHEGRPVTDDILCEYMSTLAEKVASPAWAEDGLARVIDYQERYRSAVQVATPDEQVDQLVNTHLPFQIRYQTYVSRSFGLTQKGFRQIGFREIQDIFAALPFEVAAGRQEEMKELIKAWASRVYAFGYADHQFYWDGIEPGRYSDDALWLFQAVGRFVDLTGDTSILELLWPVAGTADQERALIDTLDAILQYSAHISIGKNGLPLIDRADWNDTLNIDGEGMPGPEKEALYREQVAQGIIQEGEGLKTDMSESVMNGFLLEVARQYMVRFARMLGNTALADKWDGFGAEYRQRLQKAWKGDFFARAFLNKPNAAHTDYLGGQGDGLSNDPSLPGTYFLNSFSWSILSDVATEEQIRIMLERLEQVLLTPYGLRLTSPVKFNEFMAHTGSGDYAFGDRENGGVFKHATMMAVSALFEAARNVSDQALAGKLVDMAWDVLQRTAPFRTFIDPYTLAGNPRFCTQYTNPATGEHVGPLLSGTAPWMWLGYLRMFGVEFVEGKVVIDPVLPAHWEQAAITLNVPAGRYEIAIHKPLGRVRAQEGKEVLVEGQACDGPLPVFGDNTTHKVDVILK
ncbi:MAG: glycosyl transferase [Spartobacteria bacterium]|nr:glycosyl transferase [Spartobacteria bacterium]